MKWKGENRPNQTSCK